MGQSEQKNNLANRYDYIWNLRKNTLKPKKMRRLRLEEIVPKNVSNSSNKKVTKPKDTWRYFLENTSFHGIKYWLDDNFTRIEQIFWKIIFSVGFASAIYIVCLLYGKYQDTKTDMIIDKLQTSCYEVPFPSVTICPDFELSNETIYEALNEFIPNSTREAKGNFKEALLKLLNLNLKNYNTVDAGVDDLDFQELNNTSTSALLLKLMPDCKDIFSKCMWNFQSQNCCDIFEIQKTRYGYCYSFNSQTSINASKTEPRRAYSTDLRSGLLFTMKSPIFVDNLVALIIEDPYTFPNKGLFISFGHQYEISLRFSSLQSAQEVLELENIPNPPCKYQNGTYRYSNCKTQCHMHYFQKQCGCVPDRFFNTESNKCTLKDIKCLRSTLLNESKYLEQNSYCEEACPEDCVNYRYEISMIDRPYEKDAISMNVFFNARQGIRYKRKIVVSDLDMLVQFGGIFGLFVGGSILTLMEFTLALFKNSYSWIHQLYKLKSKK